MMEWPRLKIGAIARLKWMDVHCTGYSGFPLLKLLKKKL